MYKLLLCWRYLLTRYLALACIISVMLGVATLIVVNSVMSGFSTKLKERLHGILSDLLVESRSYEGFADPEAKMKQIRESPWGDKIEAMSPTLEIFSMIQFEVQGETITRPVHLIGIDPEGRARLGGFSQHLLRQKDNPRPTFEPDAETKKFLLQNQHPMPVKIAPNEIRRPDQPPPPDPPPSRIKIPEGIILGYAIASYRDPNASVESTDKDVYLLGMGDEVRLITVSGQKLAPVYDRFVVCDFFKSEMSEYDANYVFVPLHYLQKLRTMDNRVTSIQIKLKDYAYAEEVKKGLQAMFPTSMFLVQTWEDKQGPLLAAISIERGILNVLLFMIVGVAGFGILAIFSMIVVEKTRDIGILKALGASNGGVMKIFLGYGLLLGVVGALLGTILGLAITGNINEIEKFLSKVTGHDIFNRKVYYFDEIPTYVYPLTVILVNLGALVIAVAASVLPALRAALLHPVRALRYE